MEFFIEKTFLLQKKIVTLFLTFLPSNFSLSRSFQIDAFMIVFANNNLGSAKKEQSKFLKCHCIVNSLHTLHKKERSWHGVRTTYCYCAWVQNFTKFPEYKCTENFAGVGKRLLLPPMKLQILSKLSINPTLRNFTVKQIGGK